MSIDCKQIYAARNRSKVKKNFYTFDAAWNLAGEMALKKWGMRNASLYVSTALCNQLKRDGVDVRQKINEAKTITYTDTRA